MNADHLPHDCEAGKIARMVAAGGDVIDAMRQIAKRTV
jgi:hypothetical protein